MKIGKFRIGIKKKIIYRNQTGEPYLIRYNLFECPWFSVKIHKILLSDHDCLHDHPWAFVSFMLKGSYREEAVRLPERHKIYMNKFGYNDDFRQHLEKQYTRTRKYSAPAILYRPAEWKHRLIVRKDKPVTTLVITLKKKRQWGFWTKLGFIPWFRFSEELSCNND